MDTTEDKLVRYGAKVLLFAGGVLCGKLARYSYAEHLHLQLEACLLGASLLESVFGCSYTHPQRNIGFATYTPIEVWEGVDLLDDVYAVNAKDLVAGLRTICTTLVQSRKSLEVRRCQWFVSAAISFSSP